MKDVHNLLYAFSPGGGFGGDEDLCLRTYPGDDFVDVLGYDVYDSSGAATTPTTPRSPGCTTRSSISATRTAASTPRAP